MIGYYLFSQQSFIEKLMRYKGFIIPVYQRNYDWKKENCKQLYDDLVKIINGHRKSHFFGSLVSVYNPDGHNEEYPRMFLIVCTNINLK